MSRTAAGYIFRCKACKGVHLVSNRFIPDSEESKTILKMHCLNDNKAVKDYKRTDFRDWHGLLWDYFGNRVNPFFGGKKWLFKTWDGFYETLEEVAKTGDDCASLIMCDEFGTISDSYIKFNDEMVYLYLCRKNIYLSFKRKDFDEAISKGHWICDIVKLATNLVYCEIYNKYDYCITSLGKDDKRFKECSFAFVDDDCKKIISVENLKVRIDKNVLRYIKS